MMMMITTVYMVTYIQFIGYLWSMVNKSEMYYDTMGALTFVIGNIYSMYWLLQHQQQQQSSTSLGINFLVSALVLIWSIRLGYFLYTRIVSCGGRDKRFNNVRDKKIKLLFYWFMQNLWVNITLTPLLLLNQYTLNYQDNTKQQDDTQSITITHMLITLVWIFGFTIEVVSDQQKRVFNSIKMNHNKWIDSGLWSYSRHPNYVGECIIQLTIYLLVFNSIPIWKYRLFGLISPLFTLFLMTKISTPMLEALSDKKWINNDQYKQYKLNTPKLLF